MRAECVQGGEGVKAQKLRAHFIYGPLKKLEITFKTSRVWCIILPLNQAESASAKVGNIMAEEAPRIYVYTIHLQLYIRI